MALVELLETKGPVAIEILQKIYDDLYRMKKISVQGRSRGGRGHLEHLTPPPPPPLSLFLLPAVGGEIDSSSLFGTQRRESC